MFKIAEVFVKYDQGRQNGKVFTLIVTAESYIFFQEQTIIIKLSA